MFILFEQVSDLIDDFILSIIFPVQSESNEKY